MAGPDGRWLLISHTKSIPGDGWIDRSMEMPVVEVKKSNSHPSERYCDFSDEEK